MSHPLFGQSVPRLEDPHLLRGQGRYVDDIQLPGMAFAAFVRSPHGHAAIDGIDTAAARQLPGVYGVFTFEDLAPHLHNSRLVVGLPSSSYRQDRARPALAHGEVVYVGEPVAVVIARTRHVAEDAVALVAVDYRPLAAVSDVRAGLTKGSPTVHGDADHNLLAEFQVAYGDVAGAFRDAPHIFSDSFWLHRGGSHSMECRGVVAHFDEAEDRLTLWASTQMPHSAMHTLMDMLDYDENQVRVITPDIGGGFGPKLVVYQEDVVSALAARLTGRPVKWIEDRREHFIASTQERDQYWDMEIAVEGEAKILGIRGSLIHDHGAYTARGVNITYNSAENLTLPYVVPSYKLDIQLGLTNKVPVTPVRGAGTPQATFVMERLLDRVARELGLDRAEVRRRNLIPADSLPYETPLITRGNTKVTLDSGDYLGCQQATLAAAGWDDFPARQQAARRQGRYLGIGFANFLKATGRGPFEGATVRIGPSGTIQVSSGAAAIGQGTRTMLAQVVAAELGGDLSNISVVTGDTAAISLGIGAANSRQTVTAGCSAHVAARKVRDKALKVAAHILEAAEQDLEIEGREVRVKGAPEMAVTLGRVAQAVAGTPGYALPGGMEPGMEATEFLVIEDMAYTNGITAVEVEVDIETGAISFLNYLATHDSGRIINPMIADGQALGSAAHGIGNALYEWMGYDESAQPVTTNLADYLLVSATEMPRVQVLHHESPALYNPLGVKGVGECGILPAAAAIISAIEDALTPFGVRISHAPLRPGEIVAMIHQATERKAG